MKRFNLWAIAAAIGVSIGFLGAAFGDIISPLPYTLTNGTLADANQVMANFNQIVTNTNLNAANAGANSNITSITGLTTPLSPAQGGSSHYTAGASTGSANAQVVAAPSPNGFTLSAGKSVTFIAGFTNTNTTTLNVASTGPTNVYRQSPTGPVPLAGGEIAANNLVTAIYDGTQYQISGIDPLSVMQPCAMIDYTGFAVPSGYLTADGSSVSRATYPNLNSCLNRTAISASTTSGSKSVVVPNSALFQIGWMVSGNNLTCSDPITAIPDGTHVTVTTNASGNGATTLQIGPYAQGDCSTTFGLPNFTGRLTAGVDGNTRITTATCANPHSIGSYCGAETHTQVLAEIAAHTHTITDPGHAHSITWDTATQYPSGSSINAVTGIRNYPSGNAGPVITSTGVTNIAINSAGSGTAMAILNPVGLVYKAIKF